jgi:hypothetical protein
MKTIENVTIYKCEFCKKELKRKYSMELHEKICNNNPENYKRCLGGCGYLETEEITVSFEFSSGYDEVDYKDKKVKTFKCSKLGKLMYPYSIERRELPDKYPCTYENQEPMPKDCSDFEC